MTVFSGTEVRREDELGTLVIPRHIAIIMDGNGRWARLRGLKRIDGHREGVRSTREIVETCGKLGVEVLTLYTFSTENWRRPVTEVSSLMELLLVTVRQELENLDKNNVRLRVIGRPKDLPHGPRQALELAERHLSKNSGLILNLAISYGGRQEILDAICELLGERKTSVTEEEFSARLTTSGLCDPELLIRTSGEMRVSNFLLWQIAYAEIVVTDVLWPDFRRPALLMAIEEFNRRRRRFGGVGEE